MELKVGERGEKLRKEQIFWNFMGGVIFGEWRRRVHRNTSANISKGEVLFDKKRKKFETLFLR